MKDFEEQFGFKACYEAVVLHVEKLHEDPIRLLGKYTLRAQQDKWFNETMIDALMQYIKDNNIKWNNN